MKLLKIQYGGLLTNIKQAHFVINMFIRPTAEEPFTENLISYVSMLLKQSWQL